MAPMIVNISIALPMGMEVSRDSWQGHEVYSKRSELGQRNHELLDRASKPVEPPHKHDIELPLPRILHQALQP